MKKKINNHRLNFLGYVKNFDIKKNTLSVVLKDFDFNCGFNIEDIQNDFVYLLPPQLDFSRRLKVSQVLSYNKNFLLLSLKIFDCIEFQIAHKFKSKSVFTNKDFFNYNNCSLSTFDSDNVVGKCVRDNFIGNIGIVVGIRYTHFYNYLLVENISFKDQIMIPIVDEFIRLSTDECVYTSLPDGFMEIYK